MYKKIQNYQVTSPDEYEYCQICKDRANPEKIYCFFLRIGDKFTLNAYLCKYHATEMKSKITKLINKERLHRIALLNKKGGVK